MIQENSFQDIDCMPLNPSDNMPEALKRQNIAIDKFSLLSKEPQMNGHPNFGGSMMFASSGHLDKVSSPMNTFVKPGKVRVLIKYKHIFILDNCKNTLMPITSQSTINIFYIFLVCHFIFNILFLLLRF
jgi:hypothetical protein